MDGEPRSPPRRSRLPNRRNAITETIVVGNTTLLASIGFDETGKPAELFLTGAKDGSGMAAIIADASVVISIALQCGITPKMLAKSISRTPDGIGHITAASVIGPHSICWPPNVHPLTRQTTDTICRPNRNLHPVLLGVVGWQIYPRTLGKR